MAICATVAFCHNQFVAELSDGRCIERPEFREMALALVHAGVRASDIEFEWKAGHRMVTAGQQVGTPEVYGVVICPRRTGSFLGFERRGVRAPWLLASWYRWRARGSFLVLWADVAAWGDGGVDLRPDAPRWSPEVGGGSAPP